MESTFLARYACERMRALSRARPVFFYLSFVAPHSPYCPPAPYDTLFDPAAMPLPPRETEAQLAAKHFWLRRHRDERYGGALPAATIQDIRTQYCGLLRHLDQRIGEAVAAFRDRFGAESLVVLTSDHGDLLGEHHQFEKHLMYEAATRVPAILVGPGRLPVGQRHTGVLEQIDLLRTVMKLAGLEQTDPAVNGQDRSEELTGRVVPPADRVVFSENYVTPYRWYTAMARCQTHKLIQYRASKQSTTVEYELYDLTTDPHELINRYGMRHKARSRRHSKRRWKRVNAWRLQP